MPYLKRVTLSHDATAWARKQQVGSATAKFLLMTLADSANGQDYSCWPSQDTLIKITEMGERTIRRAANLLIEQGLIRVFYRYRADNTRRSSRYQLLVEGPETELPETVDWRSLKQATTADPPATEPTPPPVTESATTGQAVQTYRPERPVIPPTEPSKEPSVVNPGAPRTARATRIPDDFYPSPEMQEWFTAERLHTVIPNPRAEHEDFCDYWRAKAGADARKIDWPATWRRWMRTAAKRADQGGGYRTGTAGAYRSTTDTKVRQTLDLAEKFRQMEENQ